MPRRRKGRPVHGWLVLDKPYGLGSTPAVGKVRWLLEAQKAGHAGTLDPLAEGVLPIALGEATKTSPYLVDAGKTYIFDIRFGDETTTGDAEGEAAETSHVRPNDAALRDVLPRFLGEIEQVPPRYSAIKIDGRRAYDLARAGEDVEIPSRTVRIDALDLLAIDGETARLRVDCGKGTYVRSLARDIARAMGGAGHVTYLRRTRVGPFAEAAAIALEDLEGMDYVARAGTLLPIDSALDDIPAFAVDEGEAADLRLGRKVRTQLQAGTGLAKLDTTPIAICEIADNQAQPKRVFNL